MKNEEDEAFDDIARRQGGGGFQAKRAMVMDKVHAEFYEKYVRRRTAPPRRIEEDDDDDIQDYKKPWVGLTDEEVNDCIKSPNRNLFARDGTTSQRIARAIEAKLKEKNT